jgi:hypothetical protein
MRGILCSKKLAMHLVLLDVSNLMKDKLPSGDSGGDGLLHGCWTLTNAVTMCTSMCTSTILLYLKFYLS